MRDTQFGPQPQKTSLRKKNTPSCRHPVPISSNKYPSPSHSAPSLQRFPTSCLRPDHLWRRTFLRRTKTGWHRPCCPLKQIHLHPDHRSAVRSTGTETLLLQTSRQCRSSSTGAACTCVRSIHCRAWSCTETNPGTDAVSLVGNFVLVFTYVGKVELVDPNLIGGLKLTLESEIVAPPPLLPVTTASNPAFGLMIPGDLRGRQQAQQDGKLRCNQYGITSWPTFVWKTECLARLSSHGVD